MCDLLRGKDIEEARAILAYSQRSVARDWAQGARVGDRERRAQPRAGRRRPADPDGVRPTRARPSSASVRVPWAARRASASARATSRSRSRRRSSPAWDRRFIPSRCAWATSTTGSRTGTQRAPLRRLPGRGRPRSADHINAKLEHAGLSRHHDPQGRHRGRGQHPHGPPGHRDRQVRLGGRRAASRPQPDDRQGDQGQHPRDQAPRARRQARRAVGCRAAAATASPSGAR